MTQILTGACPNFVVQVSDRLVTTGRGVNIKEHDPAANKTVVYRAADALVTLGYSGIAYIGETPTDWWIAQILYQGELKATDGRLGIRIGAIAKPMRIGLAMKRLRDAVKALPAHPIDSYGLEIVIAGWQGDRAGPRPIYVEISRVAGRTRIQSSPRRWPKDRNFQIGVIGQTLQSNALEKALAPYCTGPDGPTFLPDTLDQIFVDLIRETAGDFASVGAHLMSVVLMRPGLGICGCRFRPLTPHFAIITNPTEPQTVEVSHTPWVVSSSIAYPPSLEIGKSILNLDGIDFHIFGAEPRGSLFSMTSSMRRPLPPHR